MAGKRLASLLVAVPLILSLLAVPAGAAGAGGGDHRRHPGPLHPATTAPPSWTAPAAPRSPSGGRWRPSAAPSPGTTPARTAWAEKDGVQVAVPIGQPWMTVNGHRVDLDTAAQIRDNRTYLPIRPVLEAFGAYVTWTGSPAKWW